MTDRTCTPACPRCRPWGTAAPGKAACMDPHDPRRFTSVTLDAPCIHPEPEPSLFDEEDTDE